MLLREHLPWVNWMKFFLGRYLWNVFLPVILCSVQIFLELYYFGFIWPISNKQSEIIYLFVNLVSLHQQLHCIQSPSMFVLLLTCDPFYFHSNPYLYYHWVLPTFEASQLDNKHTISILDYQLVWWSWGVFKFLNTGAHLCLCIDFCRNTLNKGICLLYLDYR